VQIGLSLALIAALMRAQRLGKVLRASALSAELGVATTVVDEHMKPLATAGFVAHTQDGSWVLAWAPESATLSDLYNALHLPFAGSWLGRISAPWQRQIEPAVRRIVRSEAATMTMTIASLLADTPESGGRRGRVRAADEVAETVGPQ
jgi:DNA-binding IscR family transcriptional regulator